DTRSLDSPPETTRSVRGGRMTSSMEARARPCQECPRASSEDSTAPLPQRPSCCEFVGEAQAPVMPQSEAAIVSPAIIRRASFFMTASWTASSLDPVLVLKTFAIAFCYVHREHHRSCGGRA